MVTEVLTDKNLESMIPKSSKSYDFDRILNCWLFEKSPLYVKISKADSEGVSSRQAVCLVPEPIYCPFADFESCTIGTTSYKKCGYWQDKLKRTGRL